MAKNVVGSILSIGGEDAKVVVPSPSCGDGRLYRSESPPVCSIRLGGDDWSAPRVYTNPTTFTIAPGESRAFTNTGSEPITVTLSHPEPRAIPQSDGASEPFPEPVPFG